MDITLVKITPSKKNNDLIFVDVTINHLGLRIKGIKCRHKPLLTGQKASKQDSPIFVHLPALEIEPGPIGTPRRQFYSPISFLSRDVHEDFVHSVRELVKGLFGDAKK